MGQRWDKGEQGYDRRKAENSLWDKHRPELNLRFFLFGFGFGFRFARLEQPFSERHVIWGGSGV
jgi:hypothetical protein